MPVIRRQFNLSTGQWPGPANQGIVSFTQFDALPRTTRVRIHRIGWFANAPAGGGPLAGAGSSVSFEWVDPLDPSSRVVLLDAEADNASTTPARFDDTAAVDLSCEDYVPRLVSTLAHFQLQVSSLLLSEAGSITTLLVDWDLEPFPDTSGRDGLAP